MHENKIGVMGDKDSVLGFKALGVSVFPVNSPSEAEGVLEELVREHFAVVFITEQTARDILDKIDRYKENRTPAIILIPGNRGSLDMGMRGVRQWVERAVGVDLLSEADS